MSKGKRNDIDQSNEGILQRIKNKCSINNNSCWVWLGITNNKGRPLCSIRGNIGLAYRHAYQAYNNKSLSSDIYLCHSCDNPLCCNPEHLFEGNNSINQLDYNSKHTKPIVERSSKTCPNNLADAERLEWYKTNACNIVDSCWIWDKEVGTDGYGRVKYKGQKHMAHRVLWMLTNNKTPDYLKQLKADGLVVKHICPIDKPNKACCNPEHLTVGSRSENARDAASYSRSYKYDEDVTEWLRLYEIYINEGNPKAHTVVAQGLINLGLVSHGVSERYVVDVLRGKNYKHLHREFFDWTPDW